MIALQYYWEAEEPQISQYDGEPADSAACRCVPAGRVVQARVEGEPVGGTA